MAYCVYTYTLKQTEEIIKNGQSRVEGNTGQKTEKENKKIKKTIQKTTTISNTDHKIIGGEPFPRERTAAPLSYHKLVMLLIR